MKSKWYGVSLYWLQLQLPGPVSVWRCHLTSIGIPHDRLIFIMDELWNLYFVKCLAFLLDVRWWSFHWIRFHAFRCLKYLLSTHVPGNGMFKHLPTKVYPTRDLHTCINILIASLFILNNMFINFARARHGQCSIFISRVGQTTPFRKLRHLCSVSGEKYVHVTTLERGRSLYIAGGIFRVLQSYASILGFVAAQCAISCYNDRNLSTLKLEVYVIGLQQSLLPHLAWYPVM